MYYVSSKCLKVRLCRLVSFCSNSSESQIIVCLMPCINSRFEPLISHQIKSSAILYFHLLIYKPLLCISPRTLTHESFYRPISNPLTSAQTLAIYHLLVFLAWNHTVWVTPAKSAISAFKTVNTLSPSSFLPYHHNLNPTICSRRDPINAMLLLEVVALCFSFLNCIHIFHFLNQLNILCPLSKPETFRVYTISPFCIQDKQKCHLSSAVFHVQFHCIPMIVTWIQLFIMMRYWRQILKL